MQTWRKMELSIRPIGKKPMHKELLTFGLFAILALLLAGCGGTTPPSGSSPTATTQATAQATTPPTQPAQSTPTPTTGISKPGAPLTRLRMLDASSGWALSAHAILKTFDGGLHWQDMTPANAGLNQYATGAFLTTQYAWIAVPPAQQVEGPGITILRTSNGGQNWQSAKIPDPLVSIVDAPHFLDAHQGWLEASSTPGAGHAGSDIWHTADGGQTWAKIASNAGANGLALGYVTGISFRDAQTGIATGNRGAGGDNTLPAIAITHDGGHTWQTQSLPHLLGGYGAISNNSQPPVFFGNTVVLPVNVSTDSGDLLVLYRSNTGGQIWFQTTVVHIHSDNAYVLDPSHAWATDTPSGLGYRTADGGTNWVRTSTTAYHLQATSFISTGIGWGIASQKLLHTTDGGQTWQPISYTFETA